MRPAGRFGIIILAMGLAWGGWWFLEGRRPRPADGPSPVARVVVELEPSASPSEPPAPEDGPPGPDRVADADRPPGPLPVDSAFPEAASSGFEGLPAIDDQIEPADHLAATDPDAAAALRRGDEARQQGRLAVAERLFRETAGRPGPAGLEARQRLAEVYWLEGRSEAVCALTEEIWREARRIGARDEARAMLTFRLAMALNPMPIDRIAASLDAALARAPQDERVWLGRGYLALREGRLDEAASWFDACRKQAPDDPVVWRARLDWAMAADRPAAVVEAMPHLDAADESPARIDELRAWLAGHRGDLETERSSLERAVAADPSDIVAIERLAGLAARAGRAEDGARLRRRKAALDEALHRYRTLFRAGESPGSSAEMARLAESLGRRFEALALWTVVQDEQPDDADARVALNRLGRDEPSRPDAGRSLAEALAGDLDVAPSRPVPVSASPRRVVPNFRDDARAAGLDFTFHNGATAQKQLPETMSGGVGLLDYDGDGRLDVYLVQGGTFPPSSSAVRSGDRLFRNRGDGRFVDVSHASGLAGFPGGYGHGVAVGDYDNDGRPDVFVTRWRSYALYHNRGDGTFEDATASAGLGGDRDWPTSAAFADLDGDGDLDLYVCHYLEWDAENPEVCRTPGARKVAACDPLRFAARPDHLFRNDGGRFVDVSKEAGIVDNDGRGLGVVAADLDEDGRLDLFVANDGTANFLFLNRGGLTFEEAGHASGVAAAEAGGYRAGMGIACGDLDGDGRPDLAVTNFFGESTTFYQNLGGGLFTDRTAAIGLAAPSRYRLGFGVAMLDADDDGRLDLLTVNGHIADERPEIPYEMPAQLMLSDARGRLTDVSAAAGAPFQVPRLGRGLAVGDLDNDGRLDAIVVGHEGPVASFHNNGPGGHSITFRLEGTRSNRDAVGARVTIEAGGRRQVADRFGGGSYQSASDPRLHFGLGAATRVDAVEVRWPSGRADRYGTLPADRRYTIREGDPTPHADQTSAKENGPDR